MVFFNPWVGPNYLSGGIFGKRIMALGESHHCRDEICKTCGKNFNSKCNNFTSVVVDWYLDQKNEHEGWMPTYRKFERSLVNHNTTPSESKEIWNSILFYNYLQVAVPKARQAGTPEQYRASENAFFSVIDQYEPELIVVWGVRLWEQLPNKRWEDGPRILADGYEVKNGYYQLANGGRSRVVCVYHPSAGYSWNYWYRVIMSC
jgi:hypothetical protein